MRSGKHSLVWFLLPWGVAFVVLTFVPLVGSCALSYTKVGAGLALGELTWVGSQHYQGALGVDHEVEPGAGDPWYWRLLGGIPRDRLVYTSLYNSLFYSFFAVPLGLCSSLVVALLLNRSFRGQSVVRAMVYLPHLLGGVATLVIWSWIFNPQFGWLNQGISMIYAGLDPLVTLFSEDGTAGWPLPGWLYSPTWCKPAVIIIHTWTMGGMMLIFLAALRRVPPGLYNAAELDGAGACRRFRHITLPQITPAILFNATVSVIFTMQSFNESYLLQNRSQNDGLLFYVVNLYEAAFAPPYRLGYACALGWILCVVLFVLIGPLLWSSRRWVHYGD